MGRVIGFCLLVALLAAATSARAGCEKDTDCKGERLCTAGECTDPAPAVAPPTPSPDAPVAAPITAPAVSIPPPVISPPTVVDPGWSKGAGITGLVMAPLALGLMIGAAVTVPEPGGSPLPSAPLGGSAMLFHTVGGAIAGAGAQSARGIEHNLGCTISGWTFYGVTIVYTALAYGIGFGLGKGPPHPAVLGVGGLLSATGIVVLSADALIVAKRAREATGQAASKRARVAFYPVLEPATRGAQAVGFTGGVGMIF